MLAVVTLTAGDRPRQLQKTPIPTETGQSVVVHPLNWPVAEIFEGARQPLCEFHDWEILAW
jgi:hypothetical protein